MPHLIPALLAASALIACGAPDEGDTHREFSFRGVSGDKIVTRPGSSDTSRVASQQEFEAFLGSKLFPLISRILWVDGEYRIVLDTAFPGIRGLPEAERTVPATSASGDSTIFDMIGQGISIGLDTVVMHTRQDTLAIRFFGFKLYSASQQSSIFGYRWLPEHEAMRKAVRAMPDLDSAVFYRIYLDYTSATGEPVQNSSRADARTFGSAAWP